MALNTKKLPAKNSNFVEQEVLEAGVYPARVVQIIDLGLQPQNPYKGKEKPPAYQIMMTYELVDVFMLDEEGNEIEDKPRWVSETFSIHNLEADMAKSTKRYKALDPDEVFEGDFSKLTDIPCNITIVHNKSGDKIYANVGNVSAMRPRDAAKCPELVNEPAVFDLSAPDMEVFNNLPKWIQDKITSNLEFQGSTLEELVGGTPDKEAPAPAKRAGRKAKAEPDPDPEDEDGEDNPY